MRMSDFTYDDITLNYIMMKSAADTKKMIVVLTNLMENEGKVDFVFNLSKIKNTHKLFIACNECRFGMGLVKDGKDTPQVATETLIEKYRVENNIDCREVYVIGFCASSYATVQIAVSKGYNAIITAFGFDGDWGLKPGMTPEKADFNAKFDARSIKMGTITNDDFIEKVKTYTGIPDYWAITKNYLLSAPADKLAIPIIYFFASEEEETYRFDDGEGTIRKMRELGMNVELTISEKGFSHFEEIPNFIEYFLDLFKRLEIN